MDIAIDESGVLLKLRFIHFHQDKIQYDTHKSTVFCRGKIPRTRSDWLSEIYSFCTHVRGGREGLSTNVRLRIQREGGSKFSIFLRT